jgi:hypothetical protein
MLFNKLKSLQLSLASASRMEQREGEKELEAVNGKRGGKGVL